MFQNIMRTLGYVPLVVLNDVHQECVRLEETLSETRDELSRMSVKNTTLETMNKNMYREMQSLQHKIKGTSLVSVYVQQDGKQVRLFIAGFRGDEPVRLPVRALLANKVNHNLLSAQADEIAEAFGITNTTAVPPGTMQP